MFEVSTLAWPFTGIMGQLERGFPTQVYFCPVSCQKVETEKNRVDEASENRKLVSEDEFSNFEFQVDNAQCHYGFTIDAIIASVAFPYFHVFHKCTIIWRQCRPEFVWPCDAIQW